MVGPSRRLRRITVPPLHRLALRCIVLPPHRPALRRIVPLPRHPARRRIVPLPGHNVWRGGVMCSGHSYSTQLLNVDKGMARWTFSLSSRFHSRQSDTIVTYLVYCRRRRKEGPGVSVRYNVMIYHSFTTVLPSVPYSSIRAAMGSLGYQTLYRLDLVQA